MQEIQTTDPICCTIATGKVEVLCVGLMRTGLQSLHTALEFLGYSTIYDQDNTPFTYELWDDVLKNRNPQAALRKMFASEDSAQVVMGMPTFCFWEEILELNPDARVILTVREENGWWQSVRKAKETMDRDVPGAPLRYGTIRRSLERFLVPSYHGFCEVLRFAWATTLGATGLSAETMNESTTKSSFRRHNTYVQSKLADRTTKDGQPQLLVFDVRDGWEPLCKFLGKAEPTQSFPSPQDVAHKYYPEGHQRPDWLDRVTGFDALFHPDSMFGARMRTELLWGLLFCSAVLTVFVIVVLAVASYVVEIPVTIVALVYLALITV
eukprot:TRINITY_DN34954_c0_g1_i1.p1 TRINITY_DN34954_c0_g1~~TRINITY_DN34954_c0_g1_i1.p1  ORF type:complete len:324 (+),score=25.48 TRINITY_DN34954_c0_g1_i1:92-1063(+)